MNNRFNIALVGLAVFASICTIAYNAISANLLIDSLYSQLDEYSNRVILCEEKLTAEKVKSNTPPMATPDVYCQHNDNTGVWECGSLSDFNEAQEPYH